MIVNLVPHPDLAAGIASRIVVINLVDLLEGDYVTDEWVDITLIGDIYVAADNVTIRGGRRTRIPLPEGQARVRLPVWSSAAGDWSILVRPSWTPYPYQIRVPAGSGEIALSAIPAL